MVDADVAIGTKPKQRGSRRWGVMVLGIVIAVIGLLTLIGGAVAGAVDQVRSSSDPIAESLMPATLRFEAGDKKYLVAVEADSQVAAETITSNTDCSIELADGTTVTLDGSVQAISTTTGNIASIGNFQGVPGNTEITCRSSRDGVRYFVDEEGSLQRYGIVAMIAGGVVLAIGTVLILLGVFTYKKPTTV